VVFGKSGKTAEGMEIISLSHVLLSQKAGSPETEKRNDSRNPYPLEEIV
jgi:hypothetical protein